MQEKKPVFFNSTNRVRVRVVVDNYNLTRSEIISEYGVDVANGNVYYTIIIQEGILIYLTRDDEYLNIVTYNTRDIKPLLTLFQGDLSKPVNLRLKYPYVSGDLIEVLGEDFKEYIEPSLELLRLLFRQR